MPDSPASSDAFAGADAALADLFHHRWSAPILAALHLCGGELGRIGPRALAAALEELEGARLPERHVGEGWPPRPSCHLTPRARRPAPALEVLAGGA